MASFEEELLMDEQDTLREIAFIRKQLPAELKSLYSDDQLRWILDTIVEYYVESGVFDTNDDEVDINIDLVAEHVCSQAAKEEQPPLNPDEVYYVIEADLDYQELS